MTRLFSSLRISACLRPTLVSLLVLCHSSLQAQEHGDLDLILLCQGIGEAVGMVREGRDSGLADDDNEGVHVIARISEHAQTDLMPPINEFIDSSDQLPAQWVATLYAHACMFDYHTDYAQVKLIARLVAVQCDLTQADLECVQNIFVHLPEQQVI